MVFRRILYSLIPSKPKVVLRFTDKFYGGAVKDLPDERDFLASGTIGSTSPSVFPTSFSLRGNGLTRVEDQGEYNSCVAHAVTTSIETFAINNGWKHPMELSRMHLWNEGRKLSGTYPGNNGMYIRDAWKTVQKPEIGVTIEKLMSYHPNSFNAEPTMGAKVFRHWYPKFNYYWIDGSSAEKREAIKKVLFEKKTPVVFATPIYASFFSYKSTEIYTSKPTEKAQFHHAMIITGWNDDKNTFEVMNSWGPLWGQTGFVQTDQDWLLTNGYSFSYPDKVSK